MRDFILGFLKTLALNEFNFIMSVINEFTRHITLRYSRLRIFKNYNIRLRLEVFFKAIGGNF